MAKRKRPDKFPRGKRGSGQWCKKIKGRFHYFGKVKDAALAVLNAEPSFERLRDQAKEIAGLLEKANIPMVRAQLSVIQEVQADEWWEGVTASMLETVRKKRHDLKVRSNEPLTAADLDALERFLAESGAGGADAIAKAKVEAKGLGLFVRSLVGLDQRAAKDALVRFLTGSTLTANQIEFVTLVTDHLVEHGFLEAAALYESPFTDVAPRGPDGLFTAPRLDVLLAILRDVRATAVAA